MKHPQAPRRAHAGEIGYHEDPELNHDGIDIEMDTRSPAERVIGYSRNSKRGAGSPRLKMGF